ncbi:tRNA N(3)-methylcytidine methyltransferase METTL6 isoform X3 [Phacochoerus africanus]|uniref:tRNA N(3)-methylcytidine methyltransferase METTL6 isoform X3 n=1 Tax=Phacochoerus africanus TaxID=41426 RepID=UPI001FD8DA8A|nr:tRNA N(3)-methylcytidine methyltransferase METTL6 isoform X3 [Phacochoerus africanus]
MASLQRKGLQARVLSSEEEEKLKRDQALVSDFKQQKLEKEAQKNWDLFYKRNSTNFFKDRHWTTREFEELRSCREQNPLYDTERCKAFQCDLTKDDLLEHVPPESVDVVTLIFVLSAVHPDKMHLVLQNIYKVLKPGKSVLFRDYGLYDHAMLRFKAGSKLAENFYVRQDGTRSYFFTDVRSRSVIFPEQKQPLPWSLEVLLSLKTLWLSLLPLPAAQLCSGVQAASTVICLPSRIPGATLSGYRLRRTGERVRVSCNSE